jgi:hypothetical protein
MSLLLYTWSKENSFSHIIELSVIPKILTIKKYEFISL